MSTDSVCVVIRVDAKYSIKDDPAFGRRLVDAITEFMGNPEPRKPVLVTVNSRLSNIGGRVIGADVGEANQVYVIREGIGERVTTLKGSQAALDALVDVLRGHGYTCRKSSV